MDSVLGSFLIDDRGKIAAACQAGWMIQGRHGHQYFRHCFPITHAATIMFWGMIEFKLQRLTVIWEQGATRET